MIDVAEAIVAERGLPAMTLREVQSSAGQANKSAATYHFGSRAGLIEAIIVARMGPINERRAELVNELNRTSPAPTVQELVEILIRPLALETIFADHSCYARFLAQASFDPATNKIISTHLRADTTVDVWSDLAKASGLPPHLADWRITSALISVVLTLSIWEGRCRSKRQAESITVDLISTCTATLMAPIERGLRDKDFILAEMEIDARA